MKSAQITILEQLAKKRNYGRTPEHAKQVMKLSLKIYEELARLGMLTESEEDKAILQSAALLHDTGLSKEPHNEAGFDMLSVEIPKALSSISLSIEETATILYCVLWHRGSAFNSRGNIEITNMLYVKKMAAILRVADALDRSLRQIVEDINLDLTEGCLNFSISSKSSADTEKRRANEKADLMKEAFNLKDVDFTRPASLNVAHMGNPPQGDSTSLKILLVCVGNTCRSPMAKVIMEQKLKAKGKLNEFEIDSAAYDSPTYQSATKQGRQAIMRLYGEDLLASHQSKKLTSSLFQQADLILVMTTRMKDGLPAEKTYTLKEYAGEAGSIADPFGGDVGTYMRVAKEISDTVDKIIPKLLSQ